MLTVDAASIGLGAALLYFDGLGDGAEAGLPLLTASYLLGGPLLHVHHRNHGCAVASLVLRVAVPVITVAIAGSAHADCRIFDPYSPHSCSRGGLIVGAYATWHGTDARETRPRTALRAGSGQRGRTATRTT